jgi:hypothetical protein
VTKQNQPKNVDQGETVFVSKKKREVWVLRCITCTCFKEVNVKEKIGSFSNEVFKPSLKTKKQTKPKVSFNFLAL